MAEDGAVTEAVAANVADDIVVAAEGDNGRVVVVVEGVGDEVDGVARKAVAAYSWVVHAAGSAHVVVWVLVEAPRAVVVAELTAVGAMIAMSVQVVMAALVAEAGPVEAGGNTKPSLEELDRRAHYEQAFGRW